VSDSREKDMAMLQKHCEQLGEHFDSVQIFVTRLESGELNGTVNINYGAGNWFTRYGQVNHWLVKSSEQARIDVRKDEEP
jgi:hypothetical protein